MKTTQVLSASGLSFAYRADAPVLRQVGLEISPGEVVALLGPNASGKSTLLRALLGQLPASGEIRWHDRPITQWTRRELARRVAYLPQAPTYDPLQTVADVLRLGRAAYWSAFGIESARDAQVVAAVAQQLELTALLSRPMDELSGGQRQRVFVGRCLVQEPAAMLLDEPGTFLDLKHQVELNALLHRLSREKNIAVLMASHDLNLAAAYADRMLLLHEGVVVAQGGSETVMTPEVLSRVYDVPLVRLDRPSGGTPVIVPERGG
jgi:iron complex transport system ATP-binding protein